MIKVLIVDDQVILRESLKFIVEQDNQINVVGCAGNGMEAVELCEQFQPHLVLMDIMMPICNGVEGTRLIKEKFDHIKVIILTTFNDDENISKALENGADGYVLKDIKPDELIMAIKGTMKGLRVVHENIFSTVVEELNKARHQKKTEEKPSIHVDLNERDIEIIKLIAEGNTNKDIATKLFLTEGTVKNIITGILKLLNVQDRIQLVIYAVRNGIV